jgi:hypothetical protein
MRAASDLLRDILRTAHVTGLSREHQEAIGEALAAQVYEAAERARLAGMLDLAPLPLSLQIVTAARDKLKAALDRPSPDPREQAAALDGVLDLLNQAIGGPIDPNAPSGG